MNPHADSAAIQRILPAVLRTPSPENSQPWEIVVEGNILLVYHVAARAKLATFPDDLCVLGAGMMAEGIELAATTEGMSAQITFLLDERTDERPWLRAELTRTGVAADPLAAALLLRHTDRRRYAGGTLRDPVFRELEAQARLSAGARLYLTDRYPAAYQQQVAAADAASFAWPEMRADLNRWLRFTERSIQRTQDGIPWRGLLRNPETWWHYLQSRLWWLETRLDWFPEWLLRLEQRVFDDSGELTPKSFSDGAGIGCVTTVSGQTADLVAAGRLALRVWLLLNLRGFSFQPMTNLTSIVYPQWLGHWRLPANLAPAVANAYAVLQQTFGYSRRETPIFTFRTGLPPAPYPANARTRRRRAAVRHADQPQREDTQGDAIQARMPDRQSTLPQ